MSAHKHSCLRSLLPTSATAVVVRGMAALLLTRPRSEPSTPPLLPPTCNFCRYVRHRREITVATLLHGLVWTRFTLRNGLRILSPEAFRRSSNIKGVAWLMIAPLLLQPPFRTLATVLPAVLAVSLSLLPNICAEAYPDSPLARCVVEGVAKGLACALLLPLLVVATVEVRARRVFLSTLAAEQAGEGSGAAAEGTTTGLAAASASRQLLWRRRLEAPAAT